MFRGLPILLLFALLLAPRASAQGQQKAPEGYPDSTTGLKNLVSDMLEATRQGDQAGLARHFHGLTVPQPSPWFQATFGEEIGNQIGEAYTRTKEQLPERLAESLKRMVTEELSSVYVIRFERRCEPTANEFQHPVLAARQKPVPLYEVRVTSAGGTRSMYLWFFAYLEGEFRFLGNVRFLPPLRPQSRLVEEQPRVIYMPKLKFPKEAREAGVQGKVRLWTVIRPDGTVEDVRVTQGHCLLAPAAEKAVREWRFAPTVIAGKAVEVVHIVELSFTLKYH